MYFMFVGCHETQQNWKYPFLLIFNICLQLWQVLNYSNSQTLTTLD